MQHELGNMTTKNMPTYLKKNIKPIHKIIWDKTIL
jgi:hypothetical protein